MQQPFVPPGFAPPQDLEGPGFRLEPLGPQHNDRDYAAWTSSLEHIRATPGFESGDWPVPMSLERNREDLSRHAADFEDRTGFTYSVLAGDDVIGCVYIYPSGDGRHDAEISSWVRESDAALDTAVWRAVSQWMETDWPFADTVYAARE